MNPFKTTVDGVLKDFTKAITKLQDLVDVEINKAEAHYTKSAKHLGKRAARMANAHRAEEVAKKMKALISA